jgi:transcriptional regulator with XRE-family HTH domain
MTGYFRLRALRDFQIEVVKQSKIKRNITGQAIRRIRLQADPHLTQENLAARLALLGLFYNQSQIAKLENGDRLISDFELFAIAKALRFRVQVFFEQADDTSFERQPFLRSNR